jgi:hypothetical protein
MAIKSAVKFDGMSQQAGLIMVGSGTQPDMSITQGVYIVEQIRLNFITAWEFLNAKSVVS